MGQDHLQERLSEQIRNITLHLLLDKDRPGKAAPGRSCSLAAPLFIDNQLSLIENGCDVGVFVLLHIVISLSLSHQLTKIAVHGGDECLEVGVLENIVPGSFTGWDSGCEALLCELSEEGL